ncbi:MAG TPA: gamma-glutamylcyclotransferase family protein [Chryseolinea sp.]|nr:gamma-glutamylcyclotransferase family protein [Chryseolinea sp.]
MNRDSQYAFYGSLMMGMENFMPYEKHLKFIGKVHLSGFKMFSLKQYPYVIRSNDADDRIVAELYKVIDMKTEQSIHELEMQEGYIFSEVEIADNKFGIYLFESHVSDSTEVASGDWRSYRKLQRF